MPLNILCLTSVSIQVYTCVYSVRTIGASVPSTHTTLHRHGGKHKSGFSIPTSLFGGSWELQQASPATFWGPHMWQSPIKEKPSRCFSDPNKLTRVTYFLSFSNFNYFSFLKHLISFVTHGFPFSLLPSMFITNNFTFTHFFKFIPHCISPFLCCYYWCSSYFQLNDAVFLFLVFFLWSRCYYGLLFLTRRYFEDVGCVSCCWATLPA